MKRHPIYFSWSVTGLLFSTLFSFSTNARAEGISPVNQFITQMGAPQFSQGGALYYPPQMYQSLAQGDTSPILQYALGQNTINQCLQNVQKYVPSLTDPYAVANSKFNYAVCLLNTCFQQVMILLSLPMLSNQMAASTDPSSIDPSSGSSSAPSPSTALIQALAQQAQQVQSCNGSSGSSGNSGSSGGGGPSVDPSLLQVAQGQH